MSQMDRRDDALRDHLKRVQDQARFNGSLEGSIDSLLTKQKARGIDVDEQLAAAFESDGKPRL